MVKKSRRSKKDSMTCGTECNMCSSYKWILPLAIITIALVPNWYTSTWGKWAIVIAAVALLLKKWCKCPGCKC